MIMVISVLILLLVLLWSYLKIKKYLAAREHSYRESEKRKCNTLVNSVQNGNITMVYSNFYRWIESLDSKIAIGFCSIIKAGRGSQYYCSRGGARTARLSLHSE